MMVVHTHNANIPKRRKWREKERCVLYVLLVLRRERKNVKKMCARTQKHTHTHTPSPPLNAALGIPCPSIAVSNGVCNLLVTHT